MVADLRHWYSSERQGSMLGALWGPSSAETKQLPAVLLSSLVAGGSDLKSFEAYEATSIFTT